MSNPGISSGPGPGDNASDSVPISVIGPHPPYRGGIAHFTERVSTALEATGRTVLRVSFSRMYPDLLFPGKSQYEPSSNETEYPAASRMLDSINPTSWRKTANFIIENGASTAVFMYWMPFFAPAFKGIIKKLKDKGIKIIGIVHNALPHESHVGAAALSSNFIQSCDSVMVLSESVKEDVARLAPACNSVLHPHPTYDQFGNSVSKDEARKKLDLHEGANVLLFFGLVRRYKGLSVLLDAMPIILANHPDTILIVAGEFYDEISPYKAQIKSHNLEKNVQLVNEYIASEDVKYYFCAADLVVQPYTEASQSGVIPIARHFRVPCIATDVGGLAEAVVNSGVVVPPSDARALGEAVSKQLLDIESSDSEPPDRVTEPTELLTWDSFVFALLEEEYRIGSA